MKSGRVFIFRHSSDGSVGVGVKCLQSHVLVARHSDIVGAGHGLQLTEELTHVGVDGGQAGAGGRVGRTCLRLTGVRII